MKSQTFVAVCLFLSLACAWAERPGDFRVIGPGGGGAMFNPTISPHDANTVLVSCDMSGSYITHDGGRTWRMFNLRGVINFLFAFDPRDPKTMYAHATGLWRSVDDGETWNLVSPSPASVQGVKMNLDHADEIILAKSDTVGEIVAMAIDPANYGFSMLQADPKEAGALCVSPILDRLGNGRWSYPVTCVECGWIHTHSTESRTLFLAGTQSLAIVNGGECRRRSTAGSRNGYLAWFGSGTQPTIYLTIGAGRVRFYRWWCYLA